MAKKDVECKVSGFMVKKLMSNAPKNDEDPGSITLTLTATKDQIHVLESMGIVNVSDVMAAFNIAQESTTPVEIGMVFSLPEEDVNQINAARGTKRS